MRSGIEAAGSQQVRDARRARCPARRCGGRSGAARAAGRGDSACRSAPRTAPAAATTRNATIPGQRASRPSRHPRPVAVRSRSGGQRMAGGLGASIGRDLRLLDRRTLRRCGRLRRGRSAAPLAARRRLPERRRRAPTKSPTRTGSARLQVREVDIDPCNGATRSANSLMLGSRRATGAWAGASTGCTTGSTRRDSFDSPTRARLRRHSHRPRPAIERDAEDQQRPAQVIHGALTPPPVAPPRPRPPSPGATRPARSS